MERRIFNYRCSSSNIKEISYKFFQDEYEIQQVAQRCHDIIWERNGLDPAHAFDELSKILLVKLYCETQIINLWDIPVKSEHKFAEKVRALFKEASQHPLYGQIFTETESLDIDDLTIFQVFKRLEPYSLLKSVDHAEGIDIKSVLYESIIGHYFRGKLGQFFTPRTIIYFMAQIVEINENTTLYDPACGSGGFLISAAKIVRKQLQQKITDLNELNKKIWEFSEHHLIGHEINERAYKVARLNLLMHGLDPSSVYQGNALKPEGNPNLLARLSNQSIDVILTNPPFAGYEKNPSILLRFEMGVNKQGKPTSCTRETLFLELILRTLKDGGVAGVVIPQGILSNKKLKNVRDFIKAHAEILAVVELPDWAFIPSGTSVRGSLLCFRKTSTPRQEYQIFFKHVENIGFASTGRICKQNDLPQAIQEYWERKPEFLFSSTKLSDRLDAKFYLESPKTGGIKFERVQLKDIGSFEVERYNPRSRPDTPILLIETSDIDPETLQIKGKKVFGQNCKYTSLKIVHCGDILISRRRAYRGAIVEVPLEYERAMVIPEFSVLRLHEGIDRNYVLEILRSKSFIDLMMRYSTGELSMRISEEDLKKLEIPLPPNSPILGQRFVSLRSKIRSFEEQIKQTNEELNSLVSSIFEGEREP